MNKQAFLEGYRLYSDKEAAAGAAAAAGKAAGAAAAAGAAGKAAGGATSIDALLKLLALLGKGGAYLGELAAKTGIGLGVAVPVAGGLTSGVLASKLTSPSIADKTNLQKALVRGEKQELLSLLKTKQQRALENEESGKSEREIRL